MRAGESMMQLGRQIRDAVGNVSRQLQAHLRDAERVQRLVDEFGPYRRYLGVAAALCLLLVCIALAQRSA